MYFVLTAQFLPNSTYSNCKSDPAVDHDHVRVERLADLTMFREYVPTNQEQKRQEQKWRLLKEERELFKKNKNAAKYVKKKAQLYNSKRNKLIKKMTEKSHLIMKNANAYVDAFFRSNIND